MGCVSGASLRQDCLRAIREAGFDEPQVQHEASFENGVSFADPQLRDAMTQFHVTEDQVREVLRGVTSLSVLALKRGTVR